MMIVPIAGRLLSSRDVPRVHLHGKVRLKSRSMSRYQSVGEIHRGFDYVPKLHSESPTEAPLQ